MRAVGVAMAGAIVMGMGVRVGVVVIVVVRVCVVVSRTVAGLDAQWRMAAAVRAGGRRVSMRMGQRHEQL